MNWKTTTLTIIILNVFNQSLGEIKPTFYVINDEASMPVVVRGKLSSDVLIVFLHGGPGGTALKKIGTRAFNLLEQDFGVAYWDQRGADASQGGTQKKWMNLNQFVEDLDILINQLQFLYPNTSIFLMGHCWGGALATAYLGDKERQTKVAGWINVAGAYNNPLGDSLSVKWVKKYAEQMINKNEDAKYWQGALRWYKKNPTFTSAQLKHYTYVSKSHGYQRIEGDSLGQFPCYTKRDLLLHPFQYAGYYLNYYHTLNNFIISDIDLTQKMRNISLPSLIIWGEMDGLIPVEMAFKAYDALATCPEDKELCIMPNTAHTVFYEQPIQFVGVVKSFINAHIRQQNSPLVCGSDSSLKSVLKK